MIYLYLAVISATALWIIGIAISILWEGRPHAKAEADAAIVLGAAAWGDKPSPVFAERIKHALELFQKGQVRIIIFTGGVGVNARRSEGEVARDYALSQGIPAEAILIEGKSKNTWQNLIEAKKLMDGSNLKTAVIVSDPLHLRRAGMIAERLGIPHLSSPTQTSKISGIVSQSNMLLKEIYFVSLLLVWGR